MMKFQRLRATVVTANTALTTFVSDGFLFDSLTSTVNMIFVFTFRVAEFVCTDCCILAYVPCAYSHRINLCWLIYLAK